MIERPEESAEWAEARVDAWVETYKKSMLTPVILAEVAAHGGIGVPELAEAVTRRTRWQLTERGLYRTVHRLEVTELLTSTATEAPRTGARRKLLGITPLGRALLAGISAHLVELPGASPGR